MATATTAQGVENTKPHESDPAINNADGTKTGDPFGSRRENINPFTLDSEGPKKDDVEVGSSPKDNRRLSSDEWDASKTPPSRFQQRKGSVYATPNSRDGHVDRNIDRDAAYHQKLKEKGWSTRRRGSKGTET